MKRWIIGLVAAVVVLAGAGFAFWYYEVRVESDPEAELAETPTTSTRAGETADGEYAIPAGTQSFVGYRAQEVVFGRSQTPTGRTSDVSGALAVSGTTVDGVEVSARLAGLSTGEDRRDGRARAALGVDQFPEATFVLTEPIELTAAPEAGITVDATAVGDLTIKGITKRVSIPIEGVWDGTQIQVVTKEPFPVTFSEFGVNVGDFQPIATVEDDGHLEFHLFFSRA
jgi:polyisoprenoid-binding protein YceI